MEPRPATRPGIYIGIDLGTSGCRAVAIDQAHRVVARAGRPMPPSTSPQPGAYEQDPQDWLDACLETLDAVCGQIATDEVIALAVDGTSATLLLADASGNPLTSGLMYNDSRAQTQANWLRENTPSDSGAHGASSSLAKLIWLHEQGLDAKANHALHQADWITGQLTGRFGLSDTNNCLKLGYDARALAWPKWMDSIPIRQELLPSVAAPGTVAGSLRAELAQRLGLPDSVKVAHGTTDGVAAFLASGANRPGQAVTSLGSTLVLKLLSPTPVSSPADGVYSHRLGDLWLVGGASNSGGAALLEHFTAERMEELTPLLDPDHPTGVDYYPLPGIGERFPVNDPKMRPRVEPVVEDDVTRFQALLEGIAAIEARGYRRLAELGAPAVTEVFTSGGGAANEPWRAIRQRLLCVPVSTPLSTEPAFGSALLALRTGQK